MEGTKQEPKKDSSEMKRLKYAQEVGGKKGSHQKAGGEGGGEYQGRLAPRTVSTLIFHHFHS